MKTNSRRRIALLVLATRTGQLSAACLDSAAPGSQRIDDIMPTIMSAGPTGSGNLGAMDLDKILEEATRLEESTRVLMSCWARVKAVQQGPLAVSKDACAGVDIQGVLFLESIGRSRIRFFWWVPSYVGASALTRDALYSTFVSCRGIGPKAAAFCFSTLDRFASCGTGIGY